MLKTHCKRGHEFTAETVRINSDGSRRCKICASLQTQKHYRANKDKCLAWHKGNYQTRKARVLAYKKQYRAEKRHLENYYSIPSYAALVASQSGLCAACHMPPDVRGLYVDHDHSCCPSKRKVCGKCVRGLICHNCNTALGHVKDSKERLLALIAYLENFELKKKAS